MAALLLANVIYLVGSANTLAAAETAEVVSERLAKLSPSEKERLRQQQERFSRLSSEQQAKLRRLDLAIERDERPDRLRQVMLGYNQWLSALPSDDRVELLKLPADQRIERIKQLLEQQEQERFKDLFESKLQPSDQKVLLDWVHNLIKRNEKRIIQQLTPLELQRIMRVEDMTQRRVMMAMLLRWKSRNVRLFELLQPTTEDLSLLSEKLSPLARDTLAAARNEAEREQLIQMWSRAVIDSRVRPTPTKEELQQFLQNVATDEQRTYLESLPPERMRFELQRLYINHRFNGSQRPGPIRGNGGRRPPTR